MARLFGTDGVRGLANRDVTAELALDLSVAAAHVLGSQGEFEGHRPRAVVGRDSRASGEFLSAAVAAGLASAGVDVVNVGVLPTPAVAYLTAALGVDIGVVLSACSHKVEVAPTHHTIEVKPIFLTVDVNIRVQKELDRLFEDVEKPDKGEGT